MEKEVKIIKCSNCGNYYEETTINVIECSECKTDKYLLENENEVNDERIYIKYCYNFFN